VTRAPATGLDLSRYLDLVPTVDPIRREGRVVQVIGLSIEVEGLALQVGEICHIFPANTDRYISAEVVGFRQDRLLVMPFAEMQGIMPGSRVIAGSRLFTVPVGEELLGRVIDGLCRPIDGRGPLHCPAQTVISAAPPPAMARRPIRERLVTGVRVIDALLTPGKGQRLGIFAGSGVGKSTLMGMICRNAACDVRIVALIGERGREVQEFVERDLGPDGLARTVVVVSTSDQPALLRIKAAWVATAIAEYFRDQGRDVAFLMDSVTRFAMAQREIGLAIGEPPTAKGYTPSVFALLPKLMERAGTGETGTISAFYTVLMEADDLTEPITDTVRSILDGHIVLSRDLAHENHFPAIDVLGSVSRVMGAVTTPEHRAAAARLRDHLATYRNARDLINIGAYVAGSNEQIDEAIRLMPAITDFLRQDAHDPSPVEATDAQLYALASGQGTAGGEP
jgi:flagellum-specific ATP synthase